MNRLPEPEPERGFNMDPVGPGLVRSPELKRKLSRNKFDDCSSDTTCDAEHEGECNVNRSLSGCRSRSVPLSLRGTETKDRGKMFLDPSYAPISPSLWLSQLHSPWSVSGLSSLTSKSTKGQSEEVGLTRWQGSVDNWGQQCLFAEAKSAGSCLTVATTFPPIDC